MCPNNSVAIKKGSKAGTIEFAHNCKPSFVACKFCLENKTKQIVKRTNKDGNIFFLMDKKIKWEGCFIKSTPN